MKKVLVIFCFVILFSFNQFTQNEKKVKKPVYKVVITATRTKKALKEIGSSVTIISAEEIKKSGKHNITELLKIIPGLKITQNGGPGQTSGVMIRGANSEHTLVMIDGIEINDPMSPSRSFNFSQLNFTNIQRVEIVRGPQSTMYGSDALGGVINIITKKGKTEKPLFSISALGGSHSTLNGSAGISGGSEKYNYSFEFSQFSTKGISAAAAKYNNPEKDGYDNSTLSGRIGYSFSNNLNFDVITRYSYGSGDADNGGGAGMDDPNNTFNAKSLLFAGIARLTLLEGKWNQQLKISQNNQNNSFTNPVDQLHPLDSSNSSFEGNIFKIDLQNNLYISRNHTIVFGLEYDKEKGESTSDWSSAWGPGESQFPQTSNSSTGLYLQNSFKLLKGFYGNFGVRFDSNKTFGGYMTYHLSGIYNLDPTDTTFNFSIGTGFKAPSLYQMFAPGSIFGPVGNAELKAEENSGREFGIRQKFLNEKISLGVTAFVNKFNHLIDFVFGSGYVNILNAKTSGLEMDFETIISNKFSIDGNYTYTKAINETTKEDLLRRPKHKLFLSFNYLPLEKLKINLNLQYQGKQMDVFPYPTIIEAPDYTLTNLSFLYNLNKKFNIFLNIDNLFDQEYEPVMGYGAFGISVYTGIKAEF